MPDVWFAIPGDPDTLTGGYVYARRLMQALPAAGWTPRLVSWPGSFPSPTDDDLRTVRNSLEGLPAGATVMIDGLAYGALPLSVLDGLNLRLVALVHHPLARETGISALDAVRLEKSERAALTRALRVIVTSPVTARTVAADFGVPTAKLHVALPGTDPAHRAAGTGAVPLILTVGTLTPRKGHDVLIAALAQIKDIPWSSRIVGGPRDPATAAKLRALVDHHQLADRITFAGEMDAAALSAVYDRADVFALASRYEGYGMVFSEALAHGLPIVACAAGAVTDTVPADAGMLVPVDNPAAFAVALRQVLTDKEAHARLAEAAWRHGQTLPTWNDTAATVARALTLTLEAAA